MGALCCRPATVDFEGEVDLFHFLLLRNVGKGAFGKVRIVQHKRTKDVYALKYIDKARCVKMKAVANVIQERRLLEEIDHPFIVNLRYAFQDDENCFLVIDLMLGGDLRFHIDRIGRLSEETVLFYVAELSSAVDFLHSQKIIHRDIKPDNILLDGDGHAHLTDFNIAVHHPEDRLLTSVAGSKAYMAPEIFLKKGYSYAIDWWSLGVTAYELVYGKRPFRGRKPAELTHSICRAALKFPHNDEQNTFSPAGVAALRGFLERSPHRRLGCEIQGGLAGIKQQAWFSRIDWQKLARKELPPILIPDPNKPNFDLTHELEELLLEERPLRVRHRKANQDISKMSEERRRMEEQFTVYDFRRMARRTYYPNNQQISNITSDAEMEYSPSRPSTPAVFDLDGAGATGKGMTSEEDIQSVEEPAPSVHIPRAE